MKAGNEYFLYSIQKELGLKIADSRVFGVHQRQVVLVDNVDGIATFKIVFLLKDAVIIPDDLISKFKKENWFKRYKR